MMKTVIAVCLMVAVCSTPARAETLYVDDITELNVRQGKGINYNIIGTLTAGEAVEMITFSSGWTKIRLPDGREGWVASRYLSKNKPAGVLVTDLEKQLESVKQQLRAASAENTRLAAENQSQTLRLEETSNRLNAAQSAYDELKQGSENYLLLKKKYDETAAAEKQKTEQIASLKNRLADAYATTGIKWFLAGAAVLLLGILIGARSKRKRSSLV